MKGMEEHPEILEIVKEEGDTRAFGETWHTDQMFNPKPAKATILYAKETPAVGGDTMFANMYLAYETLSAPMKTVVAGVKTWNVGDRKKLSQGDNMGSSAKGATWATKRWRPRCVTPETCRRSPRTLSCAPTPKPAARRSISATTRKRCTVSGTPRQSRSSNS